MATTYILESGEPYIRKRTEKGWTLDFLFNKDGFDWSGGTTFYYWGISGETEVANYADNNLSFSFTDDGRVMWESIHYKKYSCDSDPIYYTATGQTSVLCSGGTSNDFNLTIVFERNRELENCDLCNFGGTNDLITGKTITIDQLDWLTGATEVYTIVESLSEKWYENRHYRLGTLKIYLNGQKVYTLKDWEEIIPSQRDSENDLVQKFGEGTIESGDIHEGTTLFDMIEFNYYEYPFTHLQIKDNYTNNIKPNYNITECDSDCIDNLIGLGMLTSTPTPTPTITPTPSPTPTFLPTNVPTSTPTITPLPATSTPTPTNIPTSVPTSTPTSTPLPPTATPTPTFLSTNIPTATPTPTPTSTSLPSPSLISYSNMLVYANGSIESYPRSGTTWYNASTGATGVYEATLFNNPTFTEESGGYFTFNGTNQYSRFSSGSEGSSSSGFTFGIWVKTTTSNTEKTFLVRNDGSSIWSISMSKNSSNNFKVNIVNTASNNMDVIATTTTLVSDVWYYLVGRWDKSVLSIYVNGTFENSENINQFYGGAVVSTSLRDANQGWTIGRFNNTYSDFSIGQVEIYNSVLTDIQINQNFDLNRNIYGL